MADPRIVSREEWTAARTRLLTREKELTRLRDELSRERRELPWERVEKEYVFEGGNGKQTLSELFAGRSQLVVYHFMFAPEWDAGCKGCSFWADNFNGIVTHLKARDVTLVAVSRAPWTKLQAFARRLGWTFQWVSSQDTSFNFDYGVSFTPSDLDEGKAIYNYAKLEMRTSEMPGVSVFAKNADGEIFHTYSSYARGIDILNTAYHYLDLVPKGRDEGSPAFSWLRLRDEYGDGSS